MSIKDKKWFKNFIFQLCFWGVVVGLSLLGCFIGFRFSKLEERHPLYFQNSIAITLLLVIIIVEVSFLIHEFIHMITFIALGYNIRLFVIGPFSFIKELGGWKIKIKLNNIVGLGGIVLPNITELRNEEQFFNVRKDVAKAMITAPIFSAFQCVISLFLALGVTPLLSKNIQSTFSLFSLHHFLLQCI